MIDAQVNRKGHETTQALTPAPILRLENVFQEFRVRVGGSYGKRIVSAVAGISFDVQPGETFAIVGETGSGKTTLARTIIRAPAARKGRILLAGHEMSRSKRKTPRDIAGLAQIIFQDPFSALDPKWTIERIVTEPLEALGIKNSTERRRRVAEMLRLVGLSASQFGSRYARELSGGQAQRVAIARALISSPQLVICDEPVTALDVSIQAQILQLLADLKRELGLTYLLIAHDLAVVRVLADRTGTMYLGKLCEVGDTAEMFAHPAHPYTAALLSAIPPRPGESAANDRIRLLGEPPSPLSPPSGCRFRTRCAYAQDICAREEPAMREVGKGQTVACHFPLVPAS